MMNDCILFQLVNYNYNCKRLSYMPHLQLLDMAIVFYRYEQDAEQHSFRYIDYTAMNEAQMTLSQMQQAAFLQTPLHMKAQFKSMNTVIGELLTEEEAAREEMLHDNVQIPMYVISNEMRTFGAACILYPGMMDTIAEMFPDGFYILPSSIHECIIVPMSAAYSQQELNEMVRTVNETQVAPPEILADCAYQYDSSLREIVY